MYDRGDLPAGTACIAISTPGTVCRKYCDTDGDCPTGERCHNDSVSVACGAPATPLALHFCYCEMSPAGAAEI